MAAAAGIAAGVAGAAVAAVVLPPLIKGVAEAIDDAVHDEHISEKEIPIHCDLAASFGAVNHKNIADMDENLKVIISGTTRAIAKLENRSWKAITACMLQNSLLEPMVGEDICRSERIFKEGYNFLKFDGSAENNQKVVQEVMDWFSDTLIRDVDVLADTRIDIKAMSKIVAETGARVEGLITAIYKEEYVERQVVDVGVIRYPDFDHPYFKVYRIQLLAWRECDRILIGQKDKSGILGKYNMSKYKPRDSVIRALQADIRHKAAHEAVDIYVSHFGCGDKPLC